MPELRLGGNTITEISLGGNTITEAWLGGKQVYASTANITISGTITDSIVGATIASPLTYSVSGNAGSTVTFQRTVSLNTGYESHGTYTENSSIWSVSRSGNTLTFSYTIPETQEDDINNSFTVSGNASLQDYSVTGTVSATLSNCTINVDGDTTSPYNYSETRTISAGGSFDIIVTPNSGYEITPNDISLSNVGSDFTQTITQVGSTVRVRTSFAAGSSDISDDFDITATASVANVTLSGTITDATGTGTSITSSKTYSVSAQPGAAISFTKSVSLSSGYSYPTYSENSSIFSVSRSGSTLTFSGTMPTNGGTHNFTVSGNPGVITYDVTGTVSASLTNATISVDGDTTSPYTFSRTRNVNSGGSFNIIVTAAVGYQFTSIGDAVVSGLSSSLTQGTKTLNAAKNQITIPISYSAGVGNISDNFTVVASSTKLVNISGTITDSVNNATIATPLTYSINGLAGQAVSFTKTITANSGYTHGSYTENSSIWAMSRSNNTLTFSYTIPSNQTSDIVNDFTVDGAADGVNVTISGTITDNITNATISTPLTYEVSGKFGQSVFFNKTVTANSGYTHGNYTEDSDNWSMTRNGDTLTFTWDIDSAEDVVDNFTVTGSANAQVSLTSIFLRRGNNAFTACAATEQIYYIDSNNFATATEIFTNSAGSSYATAGWYSNGTTVRNWTGSAFTGFAQLCL